MSPNFQLFLFPFYLFYFSKFSKAAVITIYFFSFAYPLNIPHSNSSRYNKFTFPFPVDCSKDHLSENLSSPFISSPSDEKSEKNLCRQQDHRNGSTTDVSRTFCSKRDSHETIGRTNSREIYRAMVEKVYRDKTRDTAPFTGTEWSRCVFFPPPRVKRCL